MTDKLTRDDVEALVGPADDLMLAAILDSGVMTRACPQLGLLGRGHFWFRGGQR